MNNLVFAMYSIIFIVLQSCNVQDDKTGLVDKYIQYHNNYDTEAMNTLLSDSFLLIREKQKINKKKYQENLLNIRFLNVKNKIIATKTEGTQVFTKEEIISDLGKTIGIKFYQDVKYTIRKNKIYKMDVSWSKKDSTNNIKWDKFYNWILITCPQRFNVISRKLMSRDSSYKTLLTKMFKFYTANQVPDCKQVIVN